jgi:crotonobetainyl-CoA:carnitine CoA-transferase CaiB-like acyl-CoA transferase
LYAVIAIQAALTHRDTAGVGQSIDMALLDAQVGVLANQALNYLASGTPPRRLGNAHPNIVPYQLFPVADGTVSIGAGNDRQFRACLGVLELPHLADDPRYATNQARVANRASLAALMSAATATFTRDALLAALEAAGVPAGPINSVADVFADPQVVHRELRLDLPRAGGGTVPGVRTPIRMSETSLVYERAAPRLGGHTADILAELGYSPSEIERLKEARVVGQA